MIKTRIFHDGYEQVRLSQYLEQQITDGYSIISVSCFDYKGTQNYKVLIVLSK